MKVVLAVLQVLVGVQFLYVGGNKIITPVDQLAEQMAWVNSIPASMVPVIGILEVAGALGLILPWLTGIQPQLVRWAAIGLVLTMLGAIATHFAIGDPFSTYIAPLVFGGLSAFIAYGRTYLHPLP